MNAKTRISETETNHTKVLLIFRSANLEIIDQAKSLRINNMASV